MLHVENLGNVIYEFGRKNDGTPYINRVRDFFPYFFVEDENGEYIAIDGVKLRKVIVKDPKSIYFEKDKYNHYEADVPYTNRYIIDVYGQKDIPVQPIRKCYIDIELDLSDDLQDIDSANNPINAITVYDSFLKKYFSFTTVNFECNSSSWSCYKFTSERKLLEAFTLFVQKTDPDMILGWNLDGFDAPYIIRRMTKIGVNPNRLSRMNKTFITNRGYANIKGRILFDLLYGYKKLTQGSRSSYSLDFISKYEFGEGKKKVSFKSVIGNERNFMAATMS